MAFLISRSASKHVFFALGVNPKARDTGEGGGSDLISQATPFAVSCETSSRPCSWQSLAWADVLTMIIWDLEVHPSA